MFRVGWWAQVGGARCAGGRLQAPVPRIAVASLHVALEEGFDGEEVVVLVDGREVFSCAAVRTRLQIGLARSFDVEVAPGPHAVECRLRTRGSTVVHHVEVAGAAWVGVSLARDGAAQWRVASEPFGYV
ncbi:hypothetical protein BH20ACT9_BH20ACT9_02600 [soil metagenome]